ncbi:MAG: ABC transporter permease subunit [Chloroflexota bacterium]
MFNLFRHELTSRWVAILAWGIGLTFFSALYIGVYPDMADEMSSLADLSIYQAMGIDLASFAGYIASVVVQIMPIILGIYVIMLATGTLAGEEENGTLELIVALPLKRWQIITMKTLAILVVIFLIMLLLGAGSAATLNAVINSADVSIDVTPMQLFMALLAVYPMMIALFGMGLFFGAFMPSRRLALVVMYTFYLASYLMSSVAGLVDSLNWLHTFSVFSYVNTTATIFSDGADIADVSILLGIGLVFFGLAVWAFQGRNITVGQWMWERGRIPASARS